MNRQLALDLRDAALDRLEGKYPTFVEAARAVAVNVCLQKGYVTADDVRARIEIPPDVNHNVMGTLFRCSLFEDAGLHISEQPQGHGNRIRRWRLRDGGKP